MKNFFKLKLFWGSILILQAAVDLFATDISGNQSGTLGIGGSPYTVIGNVLVPDGQTLTIEPGVVIKFDPGYILEVAGTLIAEGTEGNEITFTSNVSVPSPGDWGQIYFHSSESSSLDHCIVEYAGAGGSNTAAINMWFSNTLVYNTVVRYTSSRAFYISNSSPVLVSCTITENQGMGIEAVDVGADPFINGCSITNNMDYAISVYASNVADIISVTVNGNVKNSIRVMEGSVNSGQWINHKVPYVIDGNILVNDGNTLIIDPGCKLFFNGLYTFAVAGALDARGTEDKRIIFGSNNQNPQPGDWNQIYFTSSDQGTILQYCSFYFGGLITSTINLENSEFIMSQIDVFYSATAGIYLSKSSPYIVDARIEGNAGIGIHASDAESDPYIDLTDFYSNGDYAISMYADNIKKLGFLDIVGNTKNSILVEGESVSTGMWYNYGVPYVINGFITVIDGDTLTIRPGNELRFTDVYSIIVNGALIAEGLPQAPIIFTSNKPLPIPGDWNQIYFNESDPASSLKYCEILYGGSTIAAVNIYASSPSINYTTIKNSFSRGMYINNSFPYIRNCTIEDNPNSGIYISSGAPDLGTEIYPGNNTFRNNNPWDVYNNTGNIIYAQKNYWVKTDSVLIDSLHIYDDDERSSKGMVIFTPFLNAEPTDIKETKESSLPDKFVLEQNYPNPFNPSTTIQYQITERGYVTIKVYDILGNEVGTLVDEEKSAGNYEIVFDASSLPSGVYFYQLKAGSFIETKKFVLLK